MARTYDSGITGGGVAQTLTIPATVAVDFSHFVRVIPTEKELRQRSKNERFVTLRDVTGPSDRQEEILISQTSGADGYANNSSIARTNRSPNRQTSRIYIHDRTIAKTGDPDDAAAPVYYYPDSLSMSFSTFLTDDFDIAAALLDRILHVLSALKLTAADGTTIDLTFLKSLIAGAVVPNVSN